VAATPLGRRLASLLARATIAAPAAACEIEIVVAPSAIGFTRPAECRLLLVPAGTQPPARLAKQADQILAINPDDPATLAAALATVG
jgi:hypothetical protein